MIQLMQGFIIQALYQHSVTIGLAFFAPYIYIARVQLYKCFVQHKVDCSLLAWDMHTCMHHDKLRNAINKMLQCSSQKFLHGIEFFFIKWVITNIPISQKVIESRLIYFNRIVSTLLNCIYNYSNIATVCCIIMNSYNQLVVFAIKYVGLQYAF